MSETYSARFIAMALGGLAIVGLSVEALSRTASTPAISEECKVMQTQFKQIAIKADRNLFEMGHVEDQIRDGGYDNFFLRLERIEKFEDLTMEADMIQAEWEVKRARLLNACGEEALKEAVIEASQDFIVLEKLSAE